MEENIIRKLMIKEPKFGKRYEYLFERFSRKWGGSEQDRRDRVKDFAKNYELYIYAFFLGLRKHKSVELEGSEKSRSNVMAIRDWKPEALRDYLVACTLAEDGTPFREYDFMKEGELDKKSFELREIVESYTNGGLSILEEEFKQDKAYFDKPFSFTEFVFE
ncbi:MAG: hypothetical protein KDC34_13900 [Saprospiraceae bacterium]|nr:hypothetical protein [Saprospiraceae bacterium]